MARQLTIEEERKVLRSLFGKRCFDAGSSRMCFNLDWEIAYDLGLDNGRDYIIKLSVGGGGLTQNSAELNFFLEHQDSGFLAEIVCFGSYILIVEKVDTTYDYKDYAENIYSDDDASSCAEDYLDNEYYYDDDIDAEEYKERFDELREAAQVIIFLASNFGCTSDNGQLGRNSKGHLVAYDYGFYAGMGCSKQCSFNLVDCLYDVDVCKDYLERIINIINELQCVADSLSVYYRTCKIEKELTA